MQPSEKIRPRKVLTVAEVIIIDEISMCRIDLFDYVMRMISDAQVSSGRKQVVLVGDFFQLPPVITEDDRAILMKLYPAISRVGRLNPITGMGSTSSRTS